MRDLDHLFQEFLGNTNDYGIIKQETIEEIKARYVRFLPVAWFNHVCMKVELYGYQGTKLNMSEIHDNNLNLANEF